MKFLRFFIPLFIGTFLWFWPCPEGLNQQAWSLFAIFVGTIVGFVAKPMPMGAVALLGILICGLTKVIPMLKCLNGFGCNVTWLIVFVYFVARGFIKTRLGIRLGYIVICVLGRSTLGLGYGLMFTEFLIAPLIPSNSARCGGIIYPLLTSISSALGSKVEDKTERRLGSYLAQVAAHGNCITSAIFLTAMAGNPMVQAVGQSMGIDITWGNWFVAAILPGLASMLIMPLVIYYIYPPTLKNLNHAKTIAKNELKIMGKMSAQEWTMAFTFLGMLILWVFAKPLSVPIEATALLGAMVLIISGILSFDDILAEKEAWHTLIWLSVLILMADTLQKLGFVGWFSQNVQTLVACNSWQWSALLLLLIYFYSHYCFAGNTAHISAMFAAFVGIAIGLGAPGLLTILVFGFFSNLYGSLTHYGSAASAVVYSGGYVSVGRWWFLGFVVSVVNFIIWLGVGVFWWRALGLW